MFVDLCSPVNRRDSAGRLAGRAGTR